MAEISSWLFEARTTSNSFPYVRAASSKASRCRKALVVAQNDPVVREKIVQRIRSSPK
jgi:hypothetical protein